MADPLRSKRRAFWLWLKHLIYGHDWYLKGLPENKPYHRCRCKKTVPFDA